MEMTFRQGGRLSLYQTSDLQLKKGKIMVKEARFAFDNPDDYQLSDLECREMDSLDPEVDWIEDLHPTKSRKKQKPKRNPKRGFSTNPDQTHSETRYLAGGDWLRKSG